MMNSMKWQRILYRSVLALGSALGVGLYLYQTEDPVSSLSYFTNQSNLLCVGLFGVLVVRELLGKTNESKVLRFLKGQATVAIVLTGLVFNLMLRPFLLTSDGYDPTTLRDFLVHVSTPLFVFGDFLLFDRRGDVGTYDPLRWMAFPALYWVYTIVYAALGGTFYLSEEATSRYPYFFMNVAEYGPLPILVVALSVVLIGYCLYWVDRGLSKREEPAA